MSTNVAQLCLTQICDSVTFPFLSSVSLLHISLCGIDNLRRQGPSSAAPTLAVLTAQVVTPSSGIVLKHAAKECVCKGRPHAMHQSGIEEHTKWFNFMPCSLLKCAQLSLRLSLSPYLSLLSNTTSNQSERTHLSSLFKLHVKSVS